MCGIAGHLSFYKKPDLDSVINLTNSIRHRGPDEQGHWTSPNGQCILGQTRLSIIDLSPLAMQPMYDPKSGNCIVFNGEIYNFQELRMLCKSKGEQFISKSDTEVILVLYRLYGIECLRFFRGMFAFAIWDEQHQYLFVARDRVGKKPLNYICDDQLGFIFCSEINPLASFPGVSKEINFQALELYLQLQYVPSPYTIYQSIHKLPPASYAIYDKNGLSIKTYWDINYRKKSNLSETKALDLLEEKLTDAVRIRMIADVPLGAMLSGGVDSSVVVALMSKLTQDPVRTYSIGFEEEEFNELPFAQHVADSRRTLHHPEIIKGDVAGLLPTLIRHYGEPYADSSAVPSFYVSKAARKHVTVALNGDGGDELLGGYPRYKLNNFQMLFSQYLGSVVPTAFAAKVGPQLILKTKSPIKKTASYLLLECMKPELRSLTMYASFFNERIRKRLLQNRYDHSYLEEWYVEVYSQACNRANHPFDRMLYMDNKNYLTGDLLVKMDIASMHCGLETRSPFLDHQLIEFCAGLPASLKYKNGEGKYLLKKIAQRYYSKEFVYRRKMGFSIPVFDWLKGPLKEMLFDILHSSLLMQEFEKTEIENQLRPFMDGEKYTASRLWTLLMFGLWKQECFLK